MNRRASYPLIALVALGSWLAPVFASASFDKDLRYGITGSSKVLDLQDFLASQNLYKGTPTGNYFSTTEEAVRAFQIQQGITPASGYFGSLTRQRVNDLLLNQGDAAGLAPASDASSTSGDPSGTTTATVPPTSFADLAQKYADLADKVMNIQNTLDSLSAWAANIEQTVNSLMNSSPAAPAPAPSPAPAPAPAKTATTTTTTAPKPTTTTTTTTTTVKTATTTTPLH